MELNETLMPVTTGHVGSGCGSAPPWLSVTVNDDGADGAILNPLAQDAACDGVMPTWVASDADPWPKSDTEGAPSTLHAWFDTFVMTTRYDSSWAGAPAHVTPRCRSCMEQEVSALGTVDSLGAVVVLGRGGAELDTLTSPATKPPAAAMASAPTP